MLAVIMGLRGKAMATLVARSRVEVCSGGEEEWEEGVVRGLLGGESVEAERLRAAGVVGGGVEVGGELGLDAHG